LPVVGTHASCVLLEISICSSSFDARRLKV
jgi:hypothetical protein